VPIGMLTICCKLRPANTTNIFVDSEDMLEYLQSRPLSSYHRIKTLDFSTIYTTISHSKLKDRLRELAQMCFIKKNGQRRYKYLVLGRDRSYFVK
jgi:hypothetical protein